jgi:hypothetical protein
MTPLKTRKTKARRQVAPVRDHMMPEAFYQGLDVGIRFAVRVLHAAGIETCQSCQGGPDQLRPDRGHAYVVPTIDMIAGADDAIGFASLRALQAYGLPVDTLSIVWNISNGLPYEKLWRVTFSKTMADRADETPIFVSCYRARSEKGESCI